MKLAKRTRRKKRNGECYACPLLAEPGKTRCTRHAKEGIRRSKERRTRLNKEGGVAKLKRNYVEYKHTAKRREMLFELSLQEFESIVSLPCFWCGDEPARNFFVGIDRKDSSIGYVLENCLPCCWPCNRMKSTFSAEDFILHVGKVFQHQKEEGL